MTNHEVTQADETMTDPRAALEEAFKVIHPEPPKGNPLAPMWYWKVWADDDARFRRFLDAEAWIDAALMLVQGPAEYPDSKTFLIDCATQTSVYSQPVAYVWDERGKHMGIGRTPALALTAACLKAKDSGDGR